MLLAVDIGNSKIKFGIFDEEKLVSRFSIPTIRNSSPLELKTAIGSKFDHPISEALVCSVVPEINISISEFLSAELGVKPVFVSNDLDFGLKINYQPLDDAGADRLVNTFSAVEKYGAPCIVCSFGTALTIDVVSRNRELIGGVIAPGMRSLATALNITTSRLPEVEIEKPAKVIQNRTVGCLQSGIVYGYFGLVDGLTARLKNEAGGNPKVIATGGFAELVAENTSCIDVVDSDLMLEGLARLYRRMAMV